MTPAERAALRERAKKDRCAHPSGPIRRAFDDREALLADCDRLERENDRLRQALTALLDAEDAL